MIKKKITKYTISISYTLTYKKKSKQYKFMRARWGCDAYLLLYTSDAEKHFKQREKPSVQVPLTPNRKGFE